jgi:hypothetical protein
MAIDPLLHYCSASKNFTRIKNRCRGRKKKIRAHHRESLSKRRGSPAPQKKSNYRES